MERFFEHVKSSFIEHIRHTLFPNMALAKFNEFDDESNKPLNISFEFRHRLNSVSFGVTMNTSNHLCISIRSKHLLTERFVTRIRDMFAHEARIFGVECLVSSTMRLFRLIRGDDMETSLVSTGPLSAKALSLLSDCSPFFVFFNLHYFELNDESNLVSANFRIRFDEQVSFEFYTVDSSGNHVYRSVEASHFHLFINETYQRMDMMRKLTNALHDYAQSICTETYMENDMLYMYDEFVGLQVQTFGAGYQLVVYGKRYMFADYDDGLHLGKKAIKQLHYNRRLKSIFK